MARMSCKTSVGTAAGRTLFSRRLAVLSLSTASLAMTANAAGSGAWLWARKIHMRSVMSCVISAPRPHNGNLGGGGNELHHGQGGCCCLAQRKTPSWLQQAAAKQVSKSQGYSCCRNHCSTANCPPSAAAAGMPELNATQCWLLAFHKACKACKLPSPAARLQRQGLLSCNSFDVLQITPGL